MSGYKNYIIIDTDITFCNTHLMSQLSSWYRIFTITITLFQVRL